MSGIVFILIGVALGAALVGAYLLGRERGRMRTIDEVARTMGGQILGRRERRDGERSQAEMAVVGETETNADGRSRQDIILKLAMGDDVDLVRERADAGEPNAVRVVSRLGQIGRLSRADAETLAPYLDGGGRVSASIAHINGGTSTNTALNVVLSVVAIDG
jgi:HIRAN domain